ncbi:hypothetical protein D3C80_1646720 [compost metagenome]
MTNGLGQRIGGFFQRRFGIKAVRIKNIDIIQPEPRQALVEAREKRLFRTAAVPVWAGPHFPASFGGDDQLIAVIGEILFQDMAEIHLGAAGRRTIIVGEVEMRDAEIESLEKNGALRFQRRGITEIVP